MIKKISKHLLNKIISKIRNNDLLCYGLYIIISLVFIWSLSKLWVPDGFVIAGHDSGLALNSGEFLKTRLFAWDDRVNFGIDNSPHFGSIILHSFDYVISFFTKTPYAGNQLAVFLWISGIFIFSFIFSHSLSKVFGKYFTFLFPIFLTFNFYIFQSIFILERAKYELIFSTLIFLTLALKIFINNKPNILKYSIISSLIITVFNGGGWFGLPLYGGLFVIAFTLILFAIAISIKEKNISYLKKIILFYLLNILFFVFLNAYSIFPYLATLLNSDYAKVISQGTITAGYEWLNYISRGSSFLNLFRLQGIPDWYLNGYGINPDHAYAGLYLSNIKFVFISFLFSIIVILGLVFSQKEKIKKYIIFFFSLLLLISIFFTSGTNSPLGFIYEFLYTKIPGFNIFRSPYYKFAPAYLIAFSFLFSYSFSKIISMVRKVKILKLIIFVLVIIGWFSFYNVLFSGKELFTWQPEKSTLVQIPDYVSEFGNWIKDNNIQGRILVAPPFDKTWRDDSYKWGYWSLSPLPSLLSKNADFVTNDININSGEENWINELYNNLLQKNKDNFFNIANRLGIKYIFLRNDYSIIKGQELGKYTSSINWFLENGYITLVKTIDQWSLFTINSNDTGEILSLTQNIFSIPKAQQYFESQIHGSNYENAVWVDTKYASENLKKIVKNNIIPLKCESCQIENLGKYAEIPVVRILPNSPLYKIKQERNNKSIIEAKDDQAKIGVYLGLIMIKFSEVRSMKELKIEDEFIDQGLKDINTYLQTINEIITKSPVDMNSFYLISRIYETLNPLQKYFRDYIISTDYNYEKSDIKDDILKVLWQSVSIKKLFDPIIEQKDRWNHEKYYNLGTLPDSTYRLIIDTQTLPVNLNGDLITPDKIILDNSNIEFKLESISEDKRFIETDSKLIDKSGGLRLYFSNLPDLFKKGEEKVLDFPEGVRGCVTGEIQNFNHTHMYRFKISSNNSVDNLRFYIKEMGGNVLESDFLRGDIEVDITTGLDRGVYQYIFAPKSNSDTPQIFLCRYDESIPLKANIKVEEIFSPLVYIVNSVSTSENNPPSLSFKKVNPTRYTIKIDKLDKDYVLVFNSRYNDLWELYNSDTKEFVVDHFNTNGYSNGWLIKKGNSQNLELVYKPQIWYEKGKIISIVSILTILTTFVYINYLNKKNKYD